MCQNGGVTRQPAGTTLDRQSRGRKLPHWDQAGTTCFITFRCGHFWQGESFDHLVRSAEKFDFLRRYIAENPIKARLIPREYVHYVRT